MKPGLRRGLAATGAVVTIVASCCWIYFTQIRTVQHNVGLHRAIGEVLAQHTASVLGKKGRVVTLSIDTKEWPELKTQIEAYKAALKKLGEYELREYEMDTKDQPKYGVGSGLSGRRYVRTVNKNTNADLFVSFIGAPKLKTDELAELAKKPKLIVESRSGDNVPDLFDSQLLNVAVVSRFQFPAPGPEKPKTAQEWFEKRYQVLTSSNAAQLPKLPKAE
jgi:hypothetical protein